MGVLDGHSNALNLYDMWLKYGDIEPEIVELLEVSTDNYDIKYGALDSIGLCATTTQGGGTIILNSNLQTQGSSAVIFILAHETIHAAVDVLQTRMGLGHDKGSLYEETIAAQFQFHVRNELNYSPGPGWRIWEIAFPTTMQSCFNLAKKASQMDTSYDQHGFNPSLEADMKDLFYYWGSGYMNIPSFPDSKYFGIMSYLGSFYH